MRPQVAPFVLDRTALAIAAPSRRRRLLAIALLLGVLAMHGFTIDHAAGINATSTMSDASNASQSGPAHAHPMPTISTPAALTIGRPNDPAHVMDDACIAILSASLLLLLTLARSLQRNRCALPALVRRRAVPVRAPPQAWQRPSLTSLCIARI